MKKGFTLIELLAVLVILAVIAVIVTPKVLSTIKESKEEALLQSGNFYIKAVDLSASTYMLDDKEITDRTYNITNGGNICLEYDLDSYTCKDVLEVDVDGKKPTGGSITLDTGKVIGAILMFGDKTIIMDDKGELVFGEYNSICKLIGGHPNAIGSKYQCKVKDDMETGFEDGYYFFVLSHNNDGTTNLIMERNIFYDEDNDVGKVATSSNTGSVAWYHGIQDNSYGPITAMTYIHNATKDWDNVPNMIMNYEDENIDYNTLQKGTTGYGAIKTIGSATVITSKNNVETGRIENLKARLPRYNEVHGQGKCLTEADNNNPCGSCPLWLSNYLNNSSYVIGEGLQNINGLAGYHILSSIADIPDSEWVVNFNGFVYGNFVDSDNQYGVRPVIELYLPNSGQILVEDITLKENELTIYKQSYNTVIPTIYPSYATNRTLKYTSSDTSVVTVNKNGEIYPVANGDATITIETTDGSKIVKKVKIYNRFRVTNLKLSGDDNITLDPNSTLQISLSISPSNAYNKTLKWTSSDESVATVDSNGLVKSLRPGTTVITATTTDESNLTKTINIVVNDWKYKNGVMSSNNSCINSGTCENGTLINVQVNDSQDYNFYVINDTGTKLTLIMDRNIGNKVAWYTGGNNNYGPITALTYLNSQTSNWDNINAITSYMHNNNLNGTTSTYGYQKLEITNGEAKLTSKDGTTITKIEGITKSRMLTLEEVDTLRKESGNTPIYLYTNLSQSNTTAAPWGYWLLKASPTSIDVVKTMIFNGNDLYYVSNVNSSSWDGVRPVIELSK